jgi:hypothetical protein
MNTDFHGFLSVFIRVHLRPIFQKEIDKLDGETAVC